MGAARTAWQWSDLIATGLGVGYLPRMPGTWGSLLGLVLAGLLASLTWWQYGLVLGLLGAVAIAAAERYRRRVGTDDPQVVVIDEVVGCVLVMWGQPWTWASAVLGFAAFRLFDIWKPWPVRSLERLPGGIGIVADDLAAGVYAWGLVWLLSRWL